MISMMILYFLISKTNKSINEGSYSDINKKQDKILLTMVISSFSLIVFNLLVFGGILTRLIGPHTFNLHRVDRTLILVLELFVVKLCVVIWKSKYRLILRGILIACILAALASGFNGIRPLDYGWLDIKRAQAVILSKYMQMGSAVFFGLCMIILIMKQKLQRYFIIPVLFLITVPHVVRSTDGLKSTCNLILNRTTSKDLAHNYFWERFDLGPFIKDVASWARNNTKPGSVFMVSNSYIDMQFKSIALRPTAISRYEIDYIPLGERPEFLRKVEEIEEAFKNKDPEEIIELAKKHKVDYIVIMQYPKYNFGKKYVYKDRYFEVFSVL